MFFFISFAVSGIDLHFVAPVICGVCIFYTSIGGLRYHFGIKIGFSIINFRVNIEKCSVKVDFGGQQIFHTWKLLLDLHIFRNDLLSFFFCSGQSCGMDGFYSIFTNVGFNYCHYYIGHKQCWWFYKCVVSCWAWRSFDYVQVNFN